MRAICESRSLPAPEDAEVQIPPVRRGYARRVRVLPGSALKSLNLWIYFQLAADGAVIFLTVSPTPPVPDYG
jgi:hypothetical protein